jgi:hypothetical protein
MANTITDLIKALSKEARSELMAGFNDEVTTFIPLMNGEFVGVHLPPNHDYEVIQEAGFFTHFRIKGKGLSNDTQAGG